MTIQNIPTSWPFVEAKKLVDRIGTSPSKPVLFETGYGPSGLPHIGTFGEVARTTWVRRAFEDLTGLPTKLIAFSDDMDALRKVPDNVPNKELLIANLGKSLTNIPDPFNKFDSFADHNNAMLREFLDKFGFDYEFASSTDYYKSGRFNDALIRLLNVHDEIVDVIAPTLGSDRRANYSPIMPIHPITGEVMQTEILEINQENHSVIWKDADGMTFETSVLNGKAKCQWKADWAMRWYALGVDYEMSGKDLIDSVKLSSKIVNILGGQAPINLTYELFLDKEGKKISKSKGNGLSIDEWLHYGTPESLSNFMFQNPTRAKKLFLEVIPKSTEEYLSLMTKSVDQTPELIRSNPVWFIHNGNVTQEKNSPVSFNSLLNLANVSNADDKETLWLFLQRYNPELTPENNPYVDSLVSLALNYFKEQVFPTKEYKTPNEMEVSAIFELRDVLSNMSVDSTADQVQYEVFEIGKKYYDNKELRKWFALLYEVLLGQTEGPRFGVFATLYGIENTIQLINEKIS